MVTSYQGISFGGFRMSACDYSLYDSTGSSIALRRQSTLVLCTLVRNHDRIVMKEDFFREVWSQIVVTDDSLVQCISDIRRTIADTDHQIVQSIPRRGYRLNSDAKTAAPELCENCRRFFEVSQTA